jgi:hypothetical protein
MHNSSHDAGPEEQPSLTTELAAIPYEPLLPAEKKLIAISLLAGFVLLGILLWVSATFFPVAPSPTITG